MKTRYMSSQEFTQRAEEIREACTAYGFMERRVCPNSFWMQVDELVNSDVWINYPKYSASSKHLATLELEGFAEILQNWIRIKEEPKVAIKYGDLIQVLPKSVAEEMVECGCGKYIYA